MTSTLLFAEPVASSALRSGERPSARTGEPPSSTGSAFVATPIFSPVLRKSRRFISVCVLPNGVLKQLKFRYVSEVRRKLTYPDRVILIIWIQIRSLNLRIEIAAFERAEREGRRPGFQRQA